MSNVHRWIVSLALMIICIAAAPRAPEELTIHALSEMAPTLTLSLVCLVLAGLIVGKPLTELVSRPICSWIDEIYFPKEKNALPPLDLRLAHSFEKEEDWDKAAVEYRRILSYYPKHSVLWIGLIRSLHENEEHEDAKVTTKMALKKFKNDSEVVAKIRSIDSEWNSHQKSSPVIPSEAESESSSS